MRAGWCKFGIDIDCRSAHSFAAQSRGILTSRVLANLTWSTQFECLQLTAGPIYQSSPNVMRKFLTLLIILLVSIVLFEPTAVRAQLYKFNQTSRPCPKLKIDGSKKSKDPLIRYKAKVSDMPDGIKPTFLWFIDGGNITSGQATSEVTIVPKREILKIRLVATNVQAQCGNTATLTTEYSGPLANSPPKVSVLPSTATLERPCPPGTSSDCGHMELVELLATASDADNDTLSYAWSVTGGTLTGAGRSVTWDLLTVGAGTYTVSVEVSDGESVSSSSATITVAECSGCRPPRPTFAVISPSYVSQGEPITFTALVSTDLDITYNWSISAGTITSGQGTSSILVDTQGLGGQTVTATLEIGGIDPAYGASLSASTTIRSLHQPPETTMITGVVYDVDGYPLAGVKIEATSGNFSKTAFTQTDGRYVLEPLATGTYTVKATKDSYSDGRRTGVILTMPGDMGEANFKLRKVP